MDERSSLKLPIFFKKKEPNAFRQKGVASRQHALMHVPSGEQLGQDKKNYLYIFLTFYINYYLLKNTKPKNSI